MNFENFFQLDAKVYPLAIMAFLRVASIMVWLPIFGDAGVPARLRVVFAFAITFCVWPAVGPHVSQAIDLEGMSPLAFLVASAREILYGFAVGFAGKMLVFAMAIGAQLVGLNMGFQTASLFSPNLSQQETAWSAFKAWVCVLLLLLFNVHHIFLSAIAESFAQVPIGHEADAAALSAFAVQIVQSASAIGIQLAAPVLAVQIACTLGVGLLNRALPQLNVFILNFPIIFLVSMSVMFLTVQQTVRYMGGQGLRQQVSAVEQAQRAFAPRPDGERKK